MVKEFALRVLKQSSHRYLAKYDETEVTLEFDLKFGINKYVILINKITGMVIVTGNNIPIILQKDIETLMLSNINRNPISIIITEYIELTHNINLKRCNGKSKFKRFFENISKRFRSKK